ncbi:MAG: cytochrome c [Altererythrobacter sp.]|jgi:mono/diheme cytochrome c family protein|nr:cytochrome c [Altererythrobacter sp.]
MYRNMLAGALLLFLALAIGGLAVAYTGVYDVSASSGHTTAGRWVLRTAMQNSVRSHAADVPEQERFTAAATHAGGSEYKAMCQQCHGGPGVTRAEWAEGLVPLPPNLTKAAADWRPNEIYWIVRHGIKMTAMPAFGGSHDEETLWNIAGFVERLLRMTPEQYAALPDDHREGATGSEADHSEHSH